ncbi:hypothetical protein WA026_013550 [Henosepilachna vigintioctopunctata]|uniref:Uncharacterized protein n=1 Tax=Henosepilachna vigintioctopunctata TaxID=420089 RepID=A0AAW1V6B1_9CUCU
MVFNNNGGRNDEEDDFDEGSEKALSEPGSPHSRKRSCSSNDGSSNASSSNVDHESMRLRSDDSRRGSRKGAVLRLCLFGCACDSCLVVGAGGGRPPDDEGGGGGVGGGGDQSEDSSGVYLTPLPTPTDSASSTPDRDQFLLPPLGPVCIQGNLRLSILIIYASQSIILLYMLAFSHRITDIYRLFCGGLVLCKN